jgi:hypothetical protein
MGKSTNWANRLCCTVLVASTLVLAGAGPVFADTQERSSRDDRGENRDVRGDQGRRDGREGNRNDRREQYRDVRRDRERRYDPRQQYRNDRKDYRDVRRDRNRRYDPRGRYREQHRAYRKPPVVIHRGKSYAARPDRVRRYRDVLIIRPHGHWYPGYAYHYHDDDAYKWLAFTAITLGLLDFMNEAQQREHEAAQIAATTAPIGERIYWEEGGASGAVIATREGTSTSGRYCREFQQEVAIGGKNEQAYGTACQNPDGSWEVISVDN